MATCKDCIHHGVCGGFTPTDLDHDVFDYCREGRTDEILDIEQRCNHFADKSRLIELPCKAGDVVYFPLPDGDCETYVDVGAVFAIGVDALHTMWISARYESGLKYYHTSEDFGKTVFLTREEAEAALAERMEDET